MQRAGRCLAGEKKMTVSTEVSHNEYTGNGVTTTFPYTFRILNKADLVVQTLDTNGNITTLVMDTTYTVTGVGSYSGGSIILPSPLASGWLITIDRELDVVQETDLRNQGKFFAEVHENAFDYLTMLIQQCFGWARRALLKPNALSKYYDAKQNQISNLADPKLGQDATNLRTTTALDNGVRQYAEQLVATVSPGSGTGAFQQFGAGAIFRTFQSKMRERVSALDFGAIPDGTNPAEETRTLQRAIDAVYANGGGVVDLGPLTWTLAPSSLSEVYDNFGVPFLASWCGIVVRKGVSLEGQVGKTKIASADANITLIALVAPDTQKLSGLELAGGWSPGVAASGHGIFQLGTAGGADISCNRVIFEDLYIHNVASYGIGLQNGNPRDCHFNNIRTDMTGADGLDLKARGNLTLPAYANSVNNVWASRMGMRLDGCSGVDMRGIWHASNINVTDFGGDATRSYTGIRFRTKPVSSDPGIEVANKSTLNGFTIVPTPGVVAASLNGVECGSDDVHISNGTVVGCHQSVWHLGNSNGWATRGSVKGVSSISARQYGFRAGVGCSEIKYDTCIDVGSVTAGFRIEADNVTAVNCTGTLSIASAASPTFIQAGGRHGASYVVTERVTDAIVALAARGTPTDIALRLVPKGTGHIGFYGDARPDAANTRYLGSNSLPWAGGFTQTAFTVTSGAKFKTDPLDITNAMLDAVAECPPIQYQLLDRVAAKGPDGARWHFGTIAERLEEAFTRHGLDVRRFAFFCEDHVPYTPAVINEETGEILEPELQEETRLGVRYEELLMLEAALHRRNYAEVIKRIEIIESR